jgi:ADP-heptose:LPS heptosyltransferase
MRLKRLELWWRALWIRLLVRLMRRAGTAGDIRPAWDARPHRVLFLRHDRAGDMILSTGVMSAIARSHSTISMDVLASPANAAILDANDYTSHVVVFDKKKIASYLPTFFRLRRAKYDAVIDCMVTAPSVTTLLLVLASGARYRIGIAGRGNDAAFNVTVPADDRPNAHMLDLLSPLASAFGGAPDLGGTHRPIITLTEAERSRAEDAWGEITGRRALINVSAGTSERVWPDANFASVMRHLRASEPEATIRVIGSPAESARAERVAREGTGSYVRTPSIRDAFALVASADFVLTPDTSITHAASAFRTPSVVLFVRGKRERWRLYDTPGENVEHTEGTLETLPLDRVLAAVDRVWNGVTISRG